MKDKAFAILAVILALQGFFPDTFHWPTDSAGWVRFFLGLTGVALGALVNANWGGKLVDPRKETL